MPRRPSAHVAVVSRRAPKKPGPTPHAILVAEPGAMLYVSAILPLEPPLAKPCTGPMRKQMELVMAHLKTVLADARFSFDEVVKVTLYLADTKHDDIVNEVYNKQFVSQSYPARTVVYVSSLSDGLQVMLDAVAIKKDEPKSPPAMAEDQMGYDDEAMY